MLAPARPGTDPAGVNYYNLPMHNRIKALEKLIEDASGLIGRLKDENSMLKQQVEALNAARGKSAANNAAARELADLKARLRRRLERICAKIEKAGDCGQPGLFEEEDEE